MLNLEMAKKMIVAAETKAQEIDVPMVTAVVDGGGNILAMERMDGALLVSLDIAKNKAYTAVALQMSTDKLAPQCQPEKPLFGIDKTDGGRIIIFGGGFPIKIDNQLVGGIGCSGGTVEEDMACAEAGLEALKEAERR